LAREHCGNARGIDDPARGNFASFILKFDFELLLRAGIEFDFFNNGRTPELRAQSHGATQNLFIKRGAIHEISRNTR
jgi:hypothetical protein